ncbi:alpha/beta fold hydrolase [Mycolicibacterium bacteremicum]|uniref:alpha/beta fold hydrolase n=1 Tax=Mycolicibacterium bacteremicum TaxID=564198 RepID=UPI001F2DAE4D|nr:alpha/beta fold hydrolase [Mycolicibacterium bacteremicum]
MAVLNPTPTSRPRRATRWIAALAAAALAVGCAPGTPAVPSHSTTASPAAIPAWCPSILHHVTECGVIERPLLAGAPQLGDIDIGYALVHHSGDAAEPAGTIMPNPGGPGSPVIAWGLDVAALTPALLDDYDVLLIDPRGVGESSPMECDIDGSAFGTGTREDQRDAVAECAANLGPRAGAYTSAATADDFDAVREHLGIDRVIPYGSSYGTYLMTVYAQRHPDRVQSMVLAGAYPLHFDPLQRPNADAVDLTLRRICERSQECDGDTAVADLRAVTAALREAPLTVDDAPVTEAEFANLVFEGATSGVGGDPDAMTPLGQLPAALHSFVGGDDGPLRDVIDDIGLPGYTPVGDDLYIAISCNDYVPLWSTKADAAQREDQYQRALAAAGTLGSFSAQGFAEAQHDGGDICIDWPAVAGHPRPDQVHTALPDVPVLVLSGDLDAVTPDANGRLTAAQFPTSTFVSVPNLGHTPDNDPSGCVADIIEQFVRTGDTGSLDCLADIPPIAVEAVSD